MKWPFMLRSTHERLMSEKSMTHKLMVFYKKKSERLERKLLYPRNSNGTFRKAR